MWRSDKSHEYDGLHGPKNHFKDQYIQKTEQKTECLHEKQRERKCSLYYLVISHKYVINI